MPENLNKPREDKIHLKTRRRRHKSSTVGTKFSVVEAYKTIRTNLQFSLNKKIGNVIMVTSTLPRDGKSTIVSNVGVAFSQAGSKVLVLDADMRKPRLNKFFNIPAVPGLSNYLAGLSPLSDVILETSYPNLHVIPSGILPPNPAELLSGEAFEELIDLLKQEYELILIDTPPANIVSDAMVVTKSSDGVIIVVRHGVTTHPEITKAIKSLEFVNAKLLGIVLNAVDYGKMYGKKYGYYNKGKYGYSYGYKYGGKESDENNVVVIENKTDDSKTQSSDK